jgi:hypothetical protein
VDRGKLAMEIYHVGTSEREKLPPLGFLVYPLNQTKEDRKTCVFEGYTMIQVKGVNCLVTLDVFMAPIGEADLKMTRDEIVECKRFDAVFSDLRSITRPQVRFIDGCEAITRIDHACKDIGAHPKGLGERMDESDTVVPVTDDTNSGNDEADHDGSAAWAPGDPPFPDKETVPTRRPAIEKVHRQ